MKKKILLMTLVPLTMMGVGLSTSLSLTSCSNNDDQPITSVPMINGENWKGWKRGTLEYDTDTSVANNYTVTYESNNSYVANDLVIPDTVVDANGTTYKVVEIGSGAFEECSGLTGSLTIGTSVTTIGSSAFAVCDSLTGALTIPDSVTSVGEGAFYNCSGFTGALTFPNSVTTIGFGAFYNCSGFTAILANFNGAPSVDEYAFYGWTTTGSPCTVKNNGVLYTSNDLLVLLKGTPKLPGNWTTAP